MWGGAGRWENFHPILHFNIMLAVIMFDWKQSRRGDKAQKETAREEWESERGEGNDDDEKERNRYQDVLLASKKFSFLLKASERDLQNYVAIAIKAEHFIPRANYSSSRAEVIWVWYPAALRLISEST